MHPTYKDIAEWLREAARLSFDTKHYGDIFEYRAAQVEAIGDDGELLTIAYVRGYEDCKKAMGDMRCGTCKYNVLYGEQAPFCFCTKLKNTFNIDFGCIHWKKKEE